MTKVKTEIGNAAQLSDDNKTKPKTDENRIDINEIVRIKNKTEKNGIETERKFLIEYPCISALLCEDGARCANIEQTYLSGTNGKTCRVRRLEENGNTTFIYTEKRRISDMSAYEDEREISESEYTELLKRADESRKPLSKTRYSVPFAGKLLEIDVYPFWNDRAVLEIELESENDTVVFPNYIKIIREITDDMRYKNVNLAKNVLFETIIHQNN